MVEDVKVLGLEVHSSFAENTEGADQSAVPNREARAAKRVLHYVAESSAHAGVDGN